MSETVEESNIQLRLRRLWKGLLFLGVACVYASILLLLLYYCGWPDALLAAFLIGLNQLFRFIANSVDQIGWQISNDDPGQTIGASTRRTQKLTLYLVFLLAQIPHLGLVYLTHTVASTRWALTMVICLLFVEYLYSRIRILNRKVGFLQASYGSSDRSAFHNGPEPLTRTETARKLELDQKLDRLEAMVEKGEISRTSYEKARDKYRIKGVLESVEKPR